MATLTADEITFIRAMSGDDCPTYDVSPELMQYLHDNAATTEPLCITSLPLGGTIVWVLRARLAKAQKLFNETGSDTNAGSVKQKRDHIKEDLEMWESKCGMNGGIVTIGSFDTQLDSDCDDSEYASYGWRWPYGLWGGS
jgi:hypothetical protein